MKPSSKIIISLLLTFILFLCFGYKVHQKWVTFKGRMYETVSLDFAYCIADFPQQCSNTKMRRCLQLLNTKENTLHNPDLSGLLAYASYRTGNTKESMRLYEQGLVSWPDFFWFHYNLGIIFYELKDYKKSMDSFEKALVSDVKKTAFLLNSSRLHGTATVLRLTREQRPLNDLYVEAHENILSLIASDYYHLKEWSKLQELSQSVLSQKKDKDIFWCYNGLAAYEIKDFPKAIYSLRNCISRDQGNREAYQTLSMIFQSIKGKEKEASLFAQKAETLNTVSRESFFNKTSINLAPF